MFVVDLMTVITFPHNDITGTDDINDNNDITENDGPDDIDDDRDWTMGAGGAPCKHHRDMCPESSEVSCHK